jgi:Secretion system C-terminal sorting domain
MFQTQSSAALVQERYVPLVSKPLINSSYQFIAIPNPASNFLSIAYSSSIESSKMNAQLISPTGAIVANTPLLGQQGTIQVDVSQWPTGLYYLRFVADDQTILIQKISIIH